MIWLTALAYYLVIVPLLIIMFIPGNRAPRWLFWSVVAAEGAGVYLTFYLLAAP